MVNFEKYFLFVQIILNILFVKCVFIIFKHTWRVMIQINLIACVDYLVFHIPKFRGFWIIPLWTNWKYM